MVALEGKMKEWLAQVEKMRLEEAAAMKGGGCCVIL